MGSGASGEPAMSQEPVPADRIPPPRNRNAWRGGGKRNSSTPVPSPADHDAGRTTVLKRVAIFGLLLPYVVALLLTLGIKSIEGHSGYTISSRDLESYGEAVVLATWLSVALSGVMSLPYFIELVKEKAREQPDSRMMALESSKLSLTYVGILVANAVLVIFVRMVAQMAVRGVR